MDTPETYSPGEGGYGRPVSGWRLRAYIIIFEADTRLGRWFDLALIWIILASVAVVMLDSMESVHAKYADVLNRLEWGFTIIFTIEYILRLACVPHPLRYAKSFYGIIDLLAVLPTYLAALVPGLHALLDVRILRLLRLFRLLKLAHYVAEYGALARALYASRRKIFVFLSFVLMVVLIMGTLMYVVEGPANGFTSIPLAVYWAITTMTTVGFGDITPQTDLGRVVASEHPVLNCRLLDVDDLSAPSSTLVELLLSDSRETQIAVRSGHQYIARLMPARPNVLASASEDGRWYPTTSYIGHPQ